MEGYVFQGERVLVILIETIMTLTEFSNIGDEMIFVVINKNMYVFLFISFLVFLIVVMFFINFRVGLNIYFYSSCVLMQHMFCMNLSRQVERPDLFLIL